MKDLLNSRLRGVIRGFSLLAALSDDAIPSRIRVLLLVGVEELSFITRFYTVLPGQGWRGPAAFVRSRRKADRRPSPRSKSRESRGRCRFVIFVLFFLRVYYFRYI